MSTSERVDGHFFAFSVFQFFLRGHNILILLFLSFLEFSVFDSFFLVFDFVFFVVFP